VRWGNIDEVAFFHVRTEPVTEQRLALARQAVGVLRAVARVFDYQAYFVCLFYQRNAVSRFVEQRLLFNIHPLEEHMHKNGVKDLSTDPSAFAYLYFYGLFVHKLGHFFDIGT
jgi:isochorismate hydrolase